MLLCRHGFAGYSLLLMMVSAGAATADPNSTATIASSVYDLLEPTTLLPRNSSVVLLGCVGPSCDHNGRGEPTHHTEENMLQRMFDLHTSFIQPSSSIFTDLTGGDENRLHHYSWQLCRRPFDPSNCTWRAIADGAFDKELIVPAARHIVANLTRPIVFALW